MSDDETLFYKELGNVSIVTIARPEARNAIDSGVAHGIEAAIDRIEANQDIRAAILTGVQPVFCAGADLAQISDGKVADLSTTRGGFAGLVRRDRTKPLIAAVDGAALAGGAELVLACDLVVASTRAVFGLPEVSRGLIASAGGLVRLARRIPASIAMQCVLTGEPLDAAVAHHHGLVNELCPAGTAVETALELAQKISNNSPLAVRESRTVLLTSLANDENMGWEQCDSSVRRVLEGHDAHEGARAFLEKRSPTWIS